ncbi:MAG: glutamate 5-kinase [Cytophagales bacterium]|nr:glutamate 5-kinase [Cytophagales bacterium]
MTNRICIKIGSNVLTNADGLPNEPLIENLVRQIADLKQSGQQVILVSSGAVAAGRSLFKSGKKLDTVAERQLLSSLGQVKLINIYTNLFARHNRLCSQVLVTKQDFKDRHHYLNMQNCLNALLSNDIIPIVNENDVISITELMFTDNDELAGLISAMLNVEKLFILTNVDGIFDGNPELETSSVIPEFDLSYKQLEEITANVRSNFGRGGIVTKCHTAQRVSGFGIEVVIANGHEKNVINRLGQGEKIGTLFRPKKKTSGRKKWIAHAHANAKGYVVVNEGARKSLISHAAVSLLPVGVVKVEGNFKKGDIIKIVDENHREIGLGQSKFSSTKAASLSGLKNQKPIIHYDHLYLH